jgi:glucan phosphoethanolaminetransferase (alkaline phosphatase superfamily)
MANDRKRAASEFRRMMVWIAVIGVLMVVAALWYISLFEPLRLHMVIATIAGVFFSVLLGSGLFALAFYSDKSGYDQNVTDATRSERDQPDI